MTFYWIKTNSFIRWLFSKYIWNIPTKDKKVYLTFDDGPTPEITTWVLETLRKKGAKATFFCIGKNAVQHPDILHKILSEGHTIGNHTQNHVNGWTQSKEDYLEDVFFCEKVFENYPTILKQKTRLFRPPYGKIKKSQATVLVQLGYKIIMWDVLSADFDLKITKEQCLNNVLSNIKSGSIVVFHDSVKSFKNLEYVLPKTIDFLREKGYECAILP